jgi:hypothetical protein
LSYGADEHRPQMEVTVDKVFVWQDGDGKRLGGGRGDSCLDFSTGATTSTSSPSELRGPHGCVIDLAPPHCPLSEVHRDPSSWAFY